MGTKNTSQTKGICKIPKIEQEMSMYIFLSPLWKCQVICHTLMCQFNTSLKVLIILSHINGFDDVSIHTFDTFLHTFDTFLHRFHTFLL